MVFRVVAVFKPYRIFFPTHVSYMTGDPVV